MFGDDFGRPEYDFVVDITVKIVNLSYRTKKFNSSGCKMSFSTLGICENGKLLKTTVFYICFDICCLRSKVCFSLFLKTI